MTNAKMTGLVGILIGIAIGGFLVTANKESLIIPGNDVLLVKYFLLICMTNCSIYFVVYGFLQFIYFIPPYYSEDKTAFERGKSSVVSVILMLPIMVSGTATIIAKSDSMLWKTLWFVFLLCFLAYFWNGINMIIKNKPAGSSAV